MKKKKTIQVVNDAKLDMEQVDLLRDEIGTKWQVVGHHHLECLFRFQDFKGALAFTNMIGKISEEERHHPDIALSYGQVKVIIYTHKVDGLSMKDFNLAKKIDAEFATFS